MESLAFRRFLDTARGLAAAGALLLAPAPAVAAPGDLLVLVDERGEPLGAPVELCFVEGLGTDCVERSPGDTPVELPAFDLLRIEGPDHGPVSVRSRDLPAAEEGVRRLTVPRKGILRVRGAWDRPLTAALHPVDDVDPARPSHSLAVPADGDLKVPAGDWVLALESRGSAPDLQMLPAVPGSTHVVQYRERSGWSLVLRAVAREGEEPVAGAAVTVRGAEPVGFRGPEREEAEERRPPRTAQTRERGLALLSGLEDPVVDAEVRHRDFVEATLPGVASTPGALELREAVLGKGAILEARIRVDGEPAAGWRCALLDRSRPSGGEGSHEVRALEAGPEGLCRGEKLPEGFLWLRVTSPDESGAAAEREVQLYDGETAEIDFDLSPIRVGGEVFEGQEPAAGYTVSVHRLSETGSTHMIEPVAEAVTDEEGVYETTVWDGGEHSFQLDDPAGQSVEMEQADVQPPATTVDFHLAPGEIEGIVVDEEGEPVAEAGVMVRWDVGVRSSARSLRAAEDGTFRLAREAETGTLQVTAEHSGFRPDSVRLELVDDAVPPPLVLTLRRGGFLQGRVVTAGGAPAAGVTVQSFEARPGGATEGKGSARTDAEGRFEVLPAETPPTRLFATGPGCPLTATDVAEPSEPVVLTCPAASGTLLLRVRDEQGRPVTGEFLFLRRGSLVIPFSVMASHLALLGQSMTSDGSGRLVIPGLPPGTYDVFLARLTSEELAAQGRAEGHVGSVTMLPGQTAELEVLAPAEP